MSKDKKTFQRESEITEIVMALDAYWREHPDLRLGQIIGNFIPFAHSDDPFYVPDFVFLDSLKEASA